MQKIDGKFYFENLTLAPIDNDLINYDQLSKIEKNYLFKYRVEVFKKISLNNKPERKWLASLINIFNQSDWLIIFILSSFAVSTFLL